jgi:hypothetical protein
MDEECGKEGAPASGAKVDRAVGGDDLERAENAKVDELSSLYRRFTGAWSRLRIMSP